MDQGVINNLKSFYRQELVQKTIAGIEDNLISSLSPAIDISSRLSLLDAVYYVAKSWRRVKAETIANCFRKCGFMAITDSTREELNMIEIEEEPALPEVTNGDGCLNMDNDAQCYEEDGKFDDEIIEEIVRKGFA